ncbi:hypothetical protein VTJ83DRAFT_6263 [Remersonia thermophila]|uniref:Uncharacterized protein n=1 Tax=Remersonia thermophila TaxID=72144 RepID=A0ABR4D461_9PEZI
MEHYNPDSYPAFGAYEEPPPPTISSEGIIAEDITERFRAAASTLDPGELVKDGYFSLFESVAALEIMDPKMDSGCLAPGESLYEDYDLARPLLPSEVIGIIDQLLSFEVAWHLGYPLSQTLFTSVYVEKMAQAPPPTLQDADFLQDRPAGSPRDPMQAVLRAYCLGLLKSCHYVNERIKQEHSYEEEDFVTNTYSRSLLETLDGDAIRDEITAARKLVGDRKGELTDEVARALDLRLELRTAFLRAIELSELRDDPDSLSAPWYELQGIWESVNETRSLGTPVPEAFSAKIQRRLASTMPPRPIVQPTPEEAHEHFKRMIADGIRVVNVLNYSDSQSLLNFVMTFQAQKPQPLVFIRSLLQSFLFHEMVILGRLSIRQILDDDLSLTVLGSSILLDPANDEIEAPHHPLFVISQQMELFRQRAAQSYLDIFRTFCQNRCRVRRTMFHALLDWESMQVDAQEIDARLQVQLKEKPLVYPAAGGAESHSLPLSSWTYLYKLRLMEWTVQLGFELDIYHPDELAGMYWYLGYLARTRAAHVGRVQFFAARRAESEHALGSNPSPSQRQAQPHRSKPYLDLAALETAYTSDLADALSWLYAALLRLGLVRPPPRPYSTEALRYHHVRMKPFAGIGLPELPSHEAFARVVAQEGTPTPALLEQAARAAAEARGKLEAVARLREKEAFAVGCHEAWLKGVKNATRAAIATVLAATSLRKAVLEGREARVKAEVPKAEKAYHEWWLVPKVVEVRE